MKTKPTTARGGVPHVAIYVRVSTEEQVREGLSLEAQPALCIAELDKRFGPGRYTSEIFIDRGKSGAMGPRPWDEKPTGRYRKDLARLITALKRSEFTHLCAYRINRIYRNFAWFKVLNDEVLRPRGVGLIFVADTYDDSAVGDVLAGVVAQIAEMERRQISENIQNTLKQRRSSGYCMGQAPFGWRYETESEKLGPRRNFVPVPDQAQVVRRIKDLYLTGYTEAPIAEILNREGIPHKRSVGRWQVATINLVLTCFAHAGLVKNADGDLVPGRHFDQRLFEPEDYERIQERLRRNRKRLKGLSISQPYRLFSGIAFCGACGQKLRSCFHSETPSYRCMGQSLGRQRTHVYINAEALKRAVLKEIEAISQSKEVQELARHEVLRQIENRAGGAKEERRKLLQAIERLDVQAGRLTDALAEGDLAPKPYRQKTEELEAQRIPLQQQLREIADLTDKAAEREQELERAYGLLQNFSQLWEQFNDHERREILHALVRRVEVHVEGDRKWIVLDLAVAPSKEIEMLRGAERWRSKELDGPAALTPRELAGLKHILDGKTYADIAQFWECSGSNAHSLLTSAVRRLEAASFEDAARKAAPIIARCLDQLPLYGRYGVRRTGKRLKTMEYHVLCLARDGSSVEDIAAQCSTTVEQIAELLSRGLAKTSTDDPARAIERAEEKDLVPVNLRNNRRNC